MSNKIVDSQNTLKSDDSKQKTTEQEENDISEEDMMDEIGNDYDNQSEALKPNQKKKRVGVKKAKTNDSQDYQSNNSDIRMGNHNKREKYKTICQKEQEEEDEILNNELRDNESMQSSPGRLRDQNHDS